MVPFAPRRSLLLLLPLATLVGCSQAPPAAPPTAPTVTPSDAPAVTEKVDVGGRKLTLMTRGSGGPTVVIEAGFGLAAVESDEWKPVFEAVAKANRVCVYDRAGLGTSDPPAKKPQTCRDTASDLHALLTNAKVPGPYVLVGHSMGGLHVRVFADMYPGDVAGVVLVDSAHPDQDGKWLASLPPESASEAPSLKAARKFLAARIEDRGKNPESLDRVTSLDQVRAARSFGSKPLAVITHSPEWKMVPDLPADVLKKIEDITQGLQAGLPALSTDSTHTIAKKAGHGIHVDEPDLVIAAIREVTGKVK